jgi:hypothetical protein
MTAAALIIGKATILPQYLLLALASILISGMMAFAVGAFANNQVAAVGVLKLLVPVGMILPVSAMLCRCNGSLLTIFCRCTGNIARCAQSCPAHPRCSISA